MNVYITGDRHGDFKDISGFCEKRKTTKEDILIILGDSGINYLGDIRDRAKKEYLSGMPITIFAIHGNHEARPNTLPDYKEKIWNGGVVYVEEEFPSLIFAKDGEIYDICGKKTIVLGGAYSVDKYFRIARGWRWYADEQPSEEIKQYAKEQLEKNEWKVDVVLSHTAPLEYEPTEAFLEGIDQERVNKDTEKWLDGIEKSLKKWIRKR